MLQFTNINCTNAGGISKVKKPILLVPGTGTTGTESFGDGSYIQLLNSNGLSYDVCLLNQPGLMLNDAQDSDEQIAYGSETPLQRSFVLHRRSGAEALRSQYSRLLRQDERHRPYLESRRPW